MRFRQHMPGFVDAEPYEIQVNSIEELLNHPNIKRLAKDKKHHRFSISKNDGKWSSSCLMHELDNGYTWFVVGYLEMTPEQTGLPIWEPRYTAAQKRKMAQPVKRIPIDENTAIVQAAKAMFGDAFRNIAEEIIKDVDGPIYKKENTENNT